jgi:pimeloyl-ACP methyl ester carboxylesterase
VTSFTSNGIAYDRGGPRGEVPIVLIHAGVADRGMWDPIWPELIGDRDVVRLDLRGFGDSAARPAGAVSHPGDVLDLLSEMGVDRCHVVGASFGAGVAVEVALARPSAVASLLLAAPGGLLLAEMTPDLRRPGRRSAPRWNAATSTRRSRQTCPGGSRARAVLLIRLTPQSVNACGACSGGRSR